jgi:hypothetical protein
MHRHPRALAVVAVALTALALQLSACGSSSTASTFTITDTTSQATSVDTTDLAGRPSSPVRIRIVSPAPGETVHGTSMHVVVAVDGGTIVATTTKNITPTEGHVHLYVDQQLIYMAYGTAQDVPVHPGTFQLQVEFVAADHAPFNPRVLTSELVTVVS